MLRHEQQSIAMALAAALHHSAGPWEKKVEMQQNAAPRGQNTPPPGARQGILAERGLQRSDRGLRRSARDTTQPSACPYWMGRRVGWSTLPPPPSSHGLSSRRRGRTRWRRPKVKVKEERRERQRRQALRQELVALLDPPVRSAQHENRINAILEILRGDAEGRSRFFFLPAREEEDKEEEKEDVTDECKGVDVLGVHVQLLFLMFLTILFFSFPLFGVWVLPEAYVRGLFWETTSGFILVSSFAWYDSGCLYGVFFCVFSTAPCVWQSLV